MLRDDTQVVVAERLSDRADVAQVRRRHADYYRRLAERADGQLRAGGPGEWLEHLQTEGANLAAAVDWHLAYDIAPLPHLLRVLFPFWALSDHQSDARAWVDHLLPAADSLGAEARAELLWTALEVDLEVGDDAAALAACEHLVPLLKSIRDPAFRAVAQLVVAGISPIVGNIDRALMEASESLEQLRGQDEPFWTALAVGSVGSVESVAGRYDDAYGHLSEARDLADSSDIAWLAAWSRAQLGTLAASRGRLDEARAVLDEALGLSLAAHSIRSVAMCLAAFAVEAFAAGALERAALLSGAVDGLHRRAGLREFPIWRRREAELIAQIRQGLGAARFDAAFNAGTRLNQRQAVAAARDVREPDIPAP